MEPPGFTKEILAELKDGWKQRPEGSSHAGMSQQWTVCRTGRVEHGISCPGNHECGTFGLWLIWSLFLRIRSGCPRGNVRVKSASGRGTPSSDSPELCCMTARGQIEVILREVGAEFPKHSLLDNRTQDLNKLILLLVALLWARGERGPMSSLCSTFSTKISFQNLSKVYRSPPVKRRTQSSSDDDGIELQLPTPTGAKQICFIISP